MTSDIFDDVLNLEEQYYREGYENGYRDGAEAGRVEGRSVGLKQGYERFLEAGRLQGRALVWANRIPRFRGPSSGDGLAPAPGTVRTSPSSSSSSSSSLPEGAPETAASGAGDPRSRRLPDLASSGGGSVGNSARLEKNVAMLYGMVEPGTLPTRNDDEAVNDFDSRLRGAQGKAKIIERAVGEKTKLDAPDVVLAAGPKNENIEDVGRIRAAPAAAGTTGPPERLTG
ncbi:hypothetical protein DL766_006176 [Monosporascus sp. MC13-8B]|uniref:Essential protein Yae1 N-terminal domain-containing protein n=1 Tax=Monosporascus cannonballus TaxID=155416 RepID=A0ABY0HDS2_9PEZI|nr:hypothetical protein DL762_002570 [Monosporascus cannonballus]RYO95215.1 hypothetical protein DL763_003783 [Monosporascus cannonballus]RYP27869.1 hypothetical protein DL766_006176 [Monosporascus sp. MC13-8B]